MKRSDTSTESNQLLSLLQNDAVGRRKDLGDFCGLLKTIEGGFSIFLDAEWGSGKTVFALQLKCLLEAANEQLSSPEGFDELIESSRDLSLISEMNDFLPVYYNAWENDHWDDPLPSVAVSIAAQGGASDSFTESGSVGEVVTSALDLVMNAAGIGISTSSVRSALKGKDLLEAYRSRESLRQSISDLVGEALVEKANRLLLIVDELDRCRPEFAMRLLEQVKNLFSDDRVIVLYSVNTGQLAHVAEGSYGAGFDGRMYLSRFYDLLVPLRRVDSSAYLRSKNHPKTSNRFDGIAYDLASSCGMTMRDINRFLTCLTGVRPEVVDNYSYSNSYVTAFAEVGIVPVLLAMKIMDQEAFGRAINEFDAAGVLEFTKLSESALTFLDEAIHGSCRKCSCTVKKQATENNR